jgi:hypothetical protein
MNICISRAGAQLGEWPEEQVRSRFQEGSLLPTDLYWKPGMAAWESLAGFMQVKPPIPAAPVTAPKNRILLWIGLGLAGCFLLLCAVCVLTFFFLSATQSAVHGVFQQASTAQGK